MALLGGRLRPFWRRARSFLGEVMRLLSVLSSSKVSSGAGDDDEEPPREADGWWFTCGAGDDEVGGDVETALIMTTDERLFPWLDSAEDLDAATTGTCAAATATGPAGVGVYDDQPGAASLSSLVVALSETDALATDAAAAAIDRDRSTE